MKAAAAVAAVKPAAVRGIGSPCVNSAVGFGGGVGSGSGATVAYDYNSDTWIVNNIRNGGGLNGDVKLRTGIGATAFDDNARDFLTLGGNGDWFFLKNTNPNRDVTPAGNASTNDFL